MNLSYETAAALLRNIDKYTAADFDALGINTEDFELLNSDMPWRRENLARVMRTFNAMIFGTLEIMGMQKIVVPSEYVAAVIVGVVGYGNMMTACIWLATERQTGIGALELSARSQTTSQIEPTNSDQLFALVATLTASEKHSLARIRLAKKLGYYQEKANQEGIEQ